MSAVGDSSGETPHDCSTFRLAVVGRFVHVVNPAYRVAARVRDVSCEKPLHFTQEQQ